MITAISIILYGMSAFSFGVFGAVHFMDKRRGGGGFAITSWVLFTLAAALQVWSVWP